MGMKQAKKFLAKVITMDARVDVLIKERESFEKMITSLPSQDYTKDRVQTSPENHTENNIIRLLEMRDEINYLIDALVDYKQDVIFLLNKMEDDNEKNVLWCRYLHGQTWEEIGETLHFSTRHVHRIHKRALQSFQDVMECHPLY